MTTRVRILLSKLARVGRREDGDQDFDEELDAHLSLLADKFVREGLSPEEARAAARRQFGNMASLKETRTEILTFSRLTAFLRDVRFGARLLRTTRGWTAVCVITLALGIGANVAIFSLVHEVLLKSLPYPAAERLVVPCTSFRGSTPNDRGPNSYADIIDWKAERDLFDGVAALTPASADLTGGAEPERVRAAYVDETFFPVMGSPPLRGRFFTADENLPAAPAVAVLSHQLWMRRFGGDPDVVGTRIEIRGVPNLIVGVARPMATWPSDAEIFLPLGTGGAPTANMLRRDNHAYRALARLRPGVTLERAQARLMAMGARIAERDTTRADTGWTLHSLASYIVGPRLRDTLIVLFGAVALVLLIACVNVTNLLLARGAAREREVAVRVALGAGWTRIASQFFAESALLSAGGGLAGTVAGYWALKALVHFAPPDLPRIHDARIDLTVLAFAVGLCAATTILAGLVPALRAARLDPDDVLRDATRSVSGGRKAGRLRSLLVVGELALAVVLLSGAGLLVRSYSRIQAVDPGIDTRDVVTMQVSLPKLRYPAAPQIASGFDQVVESIRRVPGVRAASAASALPLGGGGLYLGRVFLREGQPEPPASAETDGAWCVVRPDYFTTMGIPVLEGRRFTRDDTATSKPVIIISRSMAREMFPGASPLGRRIRSWRDENLYREIVGVAGDLRHYGLTERIPNNVYVPHSQNTWRSMALVIRTTGDPHRSMPSIRAAVRSADKLLPLADVRTLDELMDGNRSAPRFTMLLLGVFGVTALLLAGVGIYGVIAYGVTQRTRELGIRMALGAARAQVQGMVARDVLRLTGAGVVLGIAGALALTRLIQSLLFEVSATDPEALLAASLLLLLIASLAAVIPARRASQVNPVIALRSQ